MPFPFPEEPDVESFSYFLVAIPDAPEYRQAAKGAFTDLGRAGAWGLEGITSGSFVAAQSWLRAIDETWRLLEMGWPDTLLAYIDEVETLLAQIVANQQNAIPCCGGTPSTAPIPGGASSTDPVPQPIIDAGYATGASDYDGYAGYKCMAAHLFLNNIQGKLLEWEPIIELGGVILGAALTIYGAYVAVPAIAVGGLLVGLPEIIALVDALKDATPGLLTDLAESLENERDDIVCAIVQGDGIEDTIDQFDAVINAKFSTFNSLIIRSQNVRHMMQLLMYGEHGNIDIAAEFAAAGYDPADYTCCLPVDVWYVDGVSSSGTGGGVITDTSGFTDETAYNELVASVGSCQTLFVRQVTAKLRPESLGTESVDSIAANCRIQATVTRPSCAAGYTFYVRAAYGSAATYGACVSAAAGETTLDTIVVAGNGGFTIDETYQVSWDTLGLGARGCVWVKFWLESINYMECDLTMEITSVNIDS